MCIYHWHFYPGVYTEFTLFDLKRPREKLKACLPIDMLGSPLCPAEPVKNLGMWFDSDFCMSEHDQVFMSADLLCHLSAVSAYASCMNNFSSKSTRPSDMLLLLKDTLSIEDDKVFKACRSVCLQVPQSHQKQGTTTQSVQISKLQHNFLIDY